ncbi:copper ion binding protein CopP [Helicobacter suis HS5]|uniref:Copper ion binding protein CopP n=2 Tax=Helicobacter suis TaxID=104628 RepID=E7G3N1_9HELI|nr:copper ion binding protein CopP [Helicobacter suis HS5]EFX43417.1 COP-associated protein [Helicobacter suis HS1]
MSAWYLTLKGLGVFILKLEDYMQEISLKVTGMTCQHCVDKIEKFVGELEGVNKIDVSLEKQQVVVAFENPANLEAIKEAILDAGYELG